MKKTKLFNMSDILEIQDISCRNIKEKDVCEEIIDKMKNNNEKIVVRDIFYNNYMELEEPHIIYDSSVGVLIGIGEKEDIIEYYQSHLNGIKQYMESIEDPESKGKMVVEKLINETKVWKINKNQKLVDKICNIPKYIYDRIKEHEEESLEVIEIEM